MSRCPLSLGAGQDQDSDFWNLYPRAGLGRRDFGDLPPRCRGGGVAAHVMTILNLVPFLDGFWERRRVEKYLGRKV
ncbi:MAG: hypothetical protein WCO83_12575 [Alphaproteobacteria bacterium]